MPRENFLRLAWGNPCWQWCQTLIGQNGLPFRSRYFYYIVFLLAINSKDQSFLLFSRQFPLSLLSIMFSTTRACLIKVKHNFFHMCHICKVKTQFIAYPTYPSSNLQDAESCNRPKQLEPPSTVIHCLTFIDFLFLSP